MTQLVEQDPDSKQIALPKNADQPVLILSYTGGFRAPPKPGFTETPLLRVFNDGRVITGGASEQARVVNAKLTPLQLQNLIGSIVREDKFLDIEAAAISKAIEATGDTIMIADAPDTEITLTLADRQHHVKQYGTQFIGKQFPQIDSLTNLVNVERRLRRVYGWAQVGGDAEIEKMLAAINEFHKKEKPDIPAVTLDDLSWANWTSRGELQAYFIKSFPDSNNSAQRTAVVNVDAQPDGKFKIQSNVETR